MPVARTYLKLFKINNKKHFEYNYFKCKWIKLSNQKVEIGRINKETWSSL